MITKATAAFVAARVIDRVNERLPSENHLGYHAVEWLTNLVFSEWNQHRPFKGSHPGLYVNRPDLPEVRNSRVWSVRREGCPTIEIHVLSRVVCPYVSGCNVPHEDISSYI